MPVNLRIDPRAVHKFSDFRLPTQLLANLEPKFAQPLPIQKKILALNSSGCSVLAHSMPRTGKSMAAILGMLSTPLAPKSFITNLVLVPSPALADQYYENMRSIAPDGDHIKRLYRTGSPDLDEEQHREVLSRDTHTLIGTPHRVLDYLSTDPGLLQISHLKQLVVDELDVFAPSKVTEKKGPLEVLLDYLVSSSSPLLTAMATSTDSLGHFASLRGLLEKSSHPIFEAAEPEAEWPGEVRHFKTAPNDYVSALNRHWAGPGLVLVPSNLSPMKLQEKLDGLDAVVTDVAEIAGVNIDSLDRVYVLGDHTSSDLARLKWSMTGSDPKMYIFN